MTDRERTPLFKLSIALLGLGFAVAALGLTYGHGCDFDTMNTCRPFGLWTGSAFVIVGTSGLIFIAGLGLSALGGLLIAAGLWRCRSGNTRSKA